MSNRSFVLWLALMLSYVVYISAIPAADIGGQAGKDPGQPDSQKSGSNTYSVPMKMNQLFEEQRVIDKELKKVDKELKKVEKEEKKVEKEEDLVMESKQVKNPGKGGNKPESGH